LETTPARFIKYEFFEGDIMSATILRKREGISTLLTVIITIGIVVALGTFLFAWPGGLFRTGSAVAEITVTDISVVKTSGANSDASLRMMGILISIMYIFL